MSNPNTDRRPAGSIQEPEPKGFTYDPRALPLNPPRGGVRRGRSFIAERQLTAVEALHQARIASLERAAGVH